MAIIIQRILAGTLLFLIASAAPGCAPYKITPQIKRLSATSGEISIALDSAVSRLQFEADRKSDSVLILFKPPIYPWNQARIMEVRKSYDNDSVWISATGEAYSSDGRASDDANEYAFLFNSAVEQEVGFLRGTPVYRKRLPHKSWGQLGLYTILNPGVGFYYGYHTPFTEKTGLRGGIALGTADLVFITMIMLPQSEGMDRYRRTVTLRGLGLFGAILARAVVPIMYLFDMQFYRELQETPYYFDFDLFNKEANAGIRVDF